ncbi:MAG: hypothetical protein E6I38_05695 [Chloroflexi bacterium]|nr:MAG: hypothetical protein E6I38_05695 [Chloroflexota bacterium]
MILAVVDDLMIGLRIEEAAKAIGRTAEAVSSGDEARQRLRSSAVEGLVVDLGMPRLDLDNLVREARQTGAWLIAFYPHVNVELRRAGERAGVERVYPRSRFLRDLPNLLLERLEKRR